MRKDARERLPGKFRSGHSRELRSIGAVTAEVKGKDLAELVSDPAVLSVSADATVSASSYPSAPVTAPGGVNLGAGSTASVLKRALGVQDWFSGSSVTVAVIDSGIQNSIDFEGRILASYDFTQGGDEPRAVKPTDEYGHGTHVAGLIASSGASSSGKYAGVTPGARLLSLKVLNKNGSGRTSDVIRALEFAVANKTRFNIKVVNLSLGHPIFEPAATDPLVEAVEEAIRAGLIVVTAAGNFGTNPKTGQQGYAGITSPGNAPSAITVGASNTGVHRPRRRPRGAVQLARSLLVQRHRQARRRRARRQPPLERGGRQHALGHVSEPGGARKRGQAAQAERHQHGGKRRLRPGRGDARREQLRRVPALAGVRQARHFHRRAGAQRERRQGDAAGTRQRRCGTPAAGSTTG